MKEVLPIDRGKMLSLFEYRDGQIYWKKRLTNSMHVGYRAGYPHPIYKYRTVTLNGLKYKEHRIIYVMHFGAIPLGLQIDHINGIRDDNRIENLRLANDSQNHVNSKIRHNNTSGYRCIGWSKSHNKWRVKIQKDYKTHVIGAYDDITDAVNAYNAASKRMYGEYAKTADAL